MKHDRIGRLSCLSLILSLGFGGAGCRITYSPSSAPPTTAPATTVPATQPVFVSSSQFDFKTLLGDPPADGSAEHGAEVDRMLALQASRTEADERRCKSEEEVTVFSFDTVLGNGFNPKALPQTAALMQVVYDQAREVSAGAKAIWNRTRPPIADPRIHPCVKFEHTPSYPSGHAVRGIAWATLLAEIFPNQREALMARGKQIGDDRFMAGMHFPSDVVAGQTLGAEIAARLLAHPQFQAQFQSVKSECQSHMTARQAALNSPRQLQSVYNILLIFDLASAPERAELIVSSSAGF